MFTIGDIVFFVYPRIETTAHKCDACNEGDIYDCETDEWEICWQCRGTGKIYENKSVWDVSEQTVSAIVTEVTKDHTTIHYKLLDQTRLRNPDDCFKNIEDAKRECERRTIEEKRLWSERYYNRYMMKGE
jgi:hypothetical protein